MRYQNHRSAERYFADIEAGRLPEAGREALDEATLQAERVAMGLRLVGGVKLDAPAPTLERLEREGLVVRGERVRLTERGFDLHSSVAAALM